MKRRHLVLSGAALLALLLAWILSPAPRSGPAGAPEAPPATADAGDPEPAAPPRTPRRPRTATSNPMEKVTNGFHPTGGGPAGYVARDRNVSAFMHPGGVALALTGSLVHTPEHGERHGWAVKWGPVGAAAVEPRPEGELPGRVHSLVGDRKNWRTNMKSWSTMVYEEIRPGVDMTVESRPHGVKYSLHAARGSNLKGMRLKYAGARSVRATGGGTGLEITTGVGTLTETGLRVLQDGREIEARYEVTGGKEYAIVLGEHDPEGPVTVDPVIGWSTFVGGEASASVADDYGYGIAVDGAGNAYVSGYTYTVDFPADTGDLQLSGTSDAFVAQVLPSGAQGWATYLGGSSYDTAYNCTVNAGGNVFVTGYTSSPDFPVTPGAYDTVWNSNEAFIVKFAVGGASFDWATFLGGTSSDYGYGIDLGPGGDVYVGGYTYSSNFPIVGGFDAAISATPDGFVAKLNPTGTALVWSSFIGGSDTDFVQDVAVDMTSDAVYLTGYTYSPDFNLAIPLVGVYSGNSDVFVTRVNPSGASLDWSTYLGGTDSDLGYAVDADSMGHCIVTGYTYSSNFPITAGAMQMFRSGNSDAFVTKIDKTGVGAYFSTYLGGTSYDFGTGLAVGPGDDIFLTGYTSSSTFPVTGGSYDTGINGSYDTYVVRLHTSGGGILWGTFLGGSSTDYSRSAAVDAAGNVYVTGYTYSNNFPMQNPFDNSLGGSIDAFVTRVDAGGASLGWSSYLGGATGPGEETLYGLDVDAAGNSYVAGYTDSSDFPTTGGAHDTTANGSWDTFVTKIDATGTTPDWSTYLGGSSSDYGRDLRFDPNTGEVTVMGYTYSSDFPTQNAYDAVGNFKPDVFVTRLDPTGSSLVWSTYFGGSSYDYGYGIDHDGAGNVYLTGYTYSNDFPVPGAFQPVPSVYPEAFLTKFDAAGTLAWSSFLGGSDSDYGNAVAADAAGNVYVTGYTWSSDFPSTNGYDTTKSSAIDAFVTRVTSAGALDWSTYHGGSSSDYGYCVDVDPTGDAYVTGYTFSSNFFTTAGAYDETYNGSTDAFVSKFAAAGGPPVWSTYLGGSSSDYGRGIHVDGMGNVYVAGYTYSGDFPLRGAFQAFPAGSADAFATKLHATGAALAWSTYLGGSDTDYAYDIGRDASGNVFVAGVTYSQDFPMNPPGFDTTFGYTYDGFCTRIDNSSPDPPGMLGQFRTDTVTPIPVGAWTDETDYVVKAVLDDDDDDAVRLQVEIKPIDTAFDGTVTAQSAFVPPGTPVSLQLGLPAGPPPEFHWRARTLDIVGRTSSWVPFGGNSDVLPANRDLGRDTALPSIVITTPTSSPVYSTAATPIALAGTASDSQSGVKIVTWANDQGGSGTAAGTTNWSVGSVALVPGVNVITVTVEDFAGNTGVDQLTVVYDTTAPTVNITSHPDPTVTGSGTIMLSGTADDDFQIFQVTWENDRGGSGSAALSGSQPNMTWDATVSLSPGINVITVRAEDDAGNSGTDSITVNYDTVAPTVSISTPSDPTYTAAATIALTGTASDNVGLASVDWSNPAAADSGTATGTDNWSVASVTLAPGLNVISVTSTDSVGNVSAPDTVTVYYDTAGPTVAITAPPKDNPTPPPDHITGSASIPVGGTSSDDVAVVSVTWENRDAPGGGGNLISSGTAALAGPVDSPTWSDTVTLASGDNYITATATDSVGNTATDTVHVVRDTLAPSVSVTSPASTPHLTNMNPFTVTGTATDDVSVTSVDVTNPTNGTDPGEMTVGLPGTPVTWSADVTLVEGSNFINVDASDGASTTTAIIEIIYDPSPPTPVITSPTGGDTYYTNAASVALSGVAFDNRGVDSMTASPVVPVTGTTVWSSDPFALSVGANMITITAADQAGNTGDDILTVVRDNTDPTISITAPTGAAQHWTTVGSVDLGGIASDGSGIAQVIWSNTKTGGGGTATGTTTWSALGIVLDPGPNIIDAIAFDLAGNTKSTSITVYYDTGDPTVTITDPTAAATFDTNSASIALAGTASDDTGVQLVEWSNAQTGLNGAATGTSSWSVASITLAAGPNDITITATDGAGKTGTDMITITYDSTLPTITITGPGVGTYSTTTTPVPLVGTASDPGGTLVEVTWENLTTGGSGTATGLTDWTADVPLTSGDNDIQVTAHDSAGNTATDSILVTYDPAAPFVDITTPTNAITFTTGITPIGIGGTATDDVGVASVDWASDRAVVPPNGAAVLVGDAWSATVDLAEGDNVITVTATDTVGRTGTSIITITYDPTAPQIAIVNPTTAAVFSTTLPTITLGGTAVDNLQLQSVEWTNDATGEGGLADGTDNWSISDILLTEGDNLITVTAYDTVGKSGVDTLTVTFDQTNPTVAIDTPTTNPTFATSTRPLPVGGTATDNIEVALVSWVNSLGGSGDAVLAGPPDSVTWTASIYLFPGDNIITVTSFDGLGNQAVDTLTVTFTPETTAPGIQIDTPNATGTATAMATPITVGGSADDNVGVVSVTWENLETGVTGTATLTGGPSPVSWSADVPLTDGVNTIVATAEDDAGNTAMDTIVITFTAPADMTDPTVMFTLPTDLDNWAESVSPMPFTVEATDNIGISSVSWYNAGTLGNGMASPGTDPEWTGSIPLTVGTQDITVTATDPSGNTATDILTVTFTPSGVDGTSPTITVTSHSTGTPITLAVGTIDIAGTATDNVEVATVVWANAASGESATCVGINPWSALVPLLEGSNVITVTAYDTSGNKRTATLTVNFFPPPPPPERVAAGHAGDCGLLGPEFLLVAWLLRGARRRRRRRRR